MDIDSGLNKNLYKKRQKAQGKQQEKGKWLI